MRTVEAEKVLTRHHRFELLDAMRGVAALFVASLHVPPSMSAWLHFNASFLAVDLFFCLSGFVIAYSYETRLQSGMTLRSFLIARLIRLYPLYFLGMVLGVTAIILEAHFLRTIALSLSTVLTALGFGLFLLPDMFGQRISNNIFPLNQPAWSLFFEIVANLIYAFLVLRRKASSALLTVLILISLALTVDYVFVHGGSFNAGWSAHNPFSGLPRVMFSFFLGVLLFRLYKSRPALRVPQRAHGAIALLTLAAIAVVLSSSSQTIAAPFTQLCCIVLLFPSIVFLGATVTVAQRWRHACLICGEFSYAFYILHMPLLSLLSFAGKLNLQPALYQLLAPLALVLLVPLSWLAAIRFDAPIRRQLSQVRSKHP